MLTDQCFGQPSSGKLLSAADPHPDIMQRVRNLITFSPKWDVCIKFCFSGLREPGGRRGEKGKSQRGWEIPRKQDLNTGESMNSKRLRYYAQSLQESVRWAPDR